MAKYIPSPRDWVREQVELRRRAVTLPACTDAVIE